MDEELRQAYGPPSDIENTSVGMVELGGRVDEDEVAQVAAGRAPTSGEATDAEMSISWGEPPDYWQATS